MTESWRVEWNSIATPGDLLWLMFTQLTPHVEAAIKAGKAIQGGTYNVETASAFLFSAAVVGDFFWPSTLRARNRFGIAEAFPNRAHDMRHLVGIPDEEPADLDLIRNDLTHVDERLEELYVQNPDGPMIAWSDGSTSADGTRRYMNYEPEIGVLHSLGREINVVEVVAWLENLLARISKVSFQLMVRSPHIGGAEQEADNEA
jgi:hypothetical protein